MPTFVSDLRSKWDVGEFLFYFVQIAPFKYDDPNGTEAARLREVQTQNMTDIRNSGMVSTLGIGNINYCFLWRPWRNVGFVRHALQKQFLR